MTALFSVSSDNDAWKKITQYAGMSTILFKPQYNAHILVGMFVIITLPILLLCIVYFYTSGMKLRMTRGETIDEQEKQIIRIIRPTFHALKVAAIKGFPGFGADGGDTTAALQNPAMAQG